MSNNIANLNGFLSIETVNTIIVSRGQQTVSISGWIYTAPTALGGRHPFVAIGKPAQVILEQARLTSTSDYQSASEFPDTRFGVTVRSKLVSMSDRSFLEIKHISFFDLSNPLLQGQEGINYFVANTITLQGHLSLFAADTQVYEIDGKPTKVVPASISTDAPDAGGKHTVLLAGKLADLLQNRIQNHPSFGASSILSATLGGRLISVDKIIFVQAHYLSICESESVSANSYRTLERTDLPRIG